MYGVGLPELVIIIVITALLFGAPVLTFFIGYLVGKNRAAAGDVVKPPVVPASPDVAPSAPPAAKSSASTAEEPADE